MKVIDLLPLVKATLVSWREDKVMRLAGALAFYATLSIPPILLISLVIAGQVLGSQYSQAQLQRQIVAQFERLIGTQGGEAADALATIIENADRPGGGLIATVAGILTLAFGATGVFVQMQDALNTIWEVAPSPDRGLMGMVRDRFYSFTLVLTIGFLLLVSLLISAALALLDEYLQSMLPAAEWFMQGVNFILSLAIIVILFALLFKVVPAVKIEWGDVWLGAIVTAILFTVGKWAIGLYLGNSAVASTYGAAGSLVVLLLWVYYSSNIFFLGAEFTHAYATKHGSQILPAASAVPLTEEMRAQQGIPHQETTEKAEMLDAVPIGGRPPVGSVTDSTTLPSVRVGEQAPADEVEPAGKQGKLGIRYYTVALLAIFVGVWHWLRRDLRRD